jgi:hypothetical protein
MNVMRHNYFKSKWTSALTSFTLVLFAAMSSHAQTATPSWSYTGSLNTARHHHTPTLLPDGKVLVTGGDSGYARFLASAELYDPLTGKWTFTGDLNVARYGHTATLLLNGKVLVVGGDSNHALLNSAELYDPRDGYMGVYRKPECCQVAPLRSVIERKSFGRWRT